MDAITKDFKFIEKDIERVESIISCKFVGDGEDIKEIHIVSNGSRSPKQISRDIQSYLIATYDMEIDYKKISIAELPGLETLNRSTRLKIDKLFFEDNGKRATVKVALKDGLNIYESNYSGLNSSRNVERMLVKSVLDNVGQALSLEDEIVLEDIKKIQLSSTNVVLVVLSYMVQDKEMHLCGSSIIEDDYKKSVVKATLDALNRSISK